MAKIDTHGGTNGIDARKATPKRDSKLDIDQPEPTPTPGLVKKQSGNTDIDNQLKELEKQEKI